MDGVLKAPRPKGLILLVEDDFLLRTSIAGYLASNGYEVESAADGLDALMWLDSSPRKPSLILLDLTLPRIDGIRFLTLQRSMLGVAHIPVIAITGDAKRRSNLTALGFHEAFFKPLDMPKLLQTIRDLSARAAVMTEGAASLEAEPHQERNAPAAAEIERAEAQRAIRERDERLFSLCHALQTPLSVVLMRSEMLLAKPSEPGALDHGLHSICGAARMQAAIIDNVIEHSRMLEGAPDMVPVSVDLASCVHDVLSRFEYQAGERKIETRLHIEAGAWIVRGDPARLTLAIHNLVGNAMKFTPSGGTVDVSLTRGATTASVRVADTGPGFSAEDGVHLFKPLPMRDSDTPYRSRSLGLGLVVVRWIALIHGGTISAASAGPSRGATFVLTIPAIAADQRRT